MVVSPADPDIRMPDAAELEAYRREQADRLGQPRTATVERGRVIDFLLALDEPADLDGDIVPELFLLTLGRTRRPQGGSGGVKAGDDYEFLEPVRVGDRITVALRLMDVMPKRSKRGLMYEISVERLFTRADGVLVARAIDRSLRWP